MIKIFKIKYQKSTFQIFIFVNYCNIFKDFFPLILKKYFLLDLLNVFLNFLKLI